MKMTTIWTATALATLFSFTAAAESPKPASTLDDLLDSPAPVAKKAEVKKAEAKKAEAETKKAEVKKPVVKAESAKPVAKKVEAPKPVAKKVEAPKPAAQAVAKKAETKKAEAEAKKAEAKKPVVKVEEVVDEIDLSGADDSAHAAKGKAAVTLKKPVAATPQAVETVPATGAEIAAKFLAADAQALVDITSDDATLTDILRQFRKTTGANIIYAESSNLQQRVSVSLRQVPWLQAMGSILNSRGFRVESVGDIHFIKEDKALDPTFTRSFLLNHASVEDLAKLFNDSYGTKTPDGKQLLKGVATAFPGANTVVVTASERVLADCEKIIKAVDKAVPQIYIEARFLELSNQSMHKLGVQWNQLESWGASVHDLNAGIEYNNGRMNKFRTTETTTATTTTTGTSSSDNTTSQSISLNNTLKPLEVTNERLINSDSRGADMMWRNARVFSGQLSPDDFSLALSAFEKLEDARVFSNPKIVVSNGREALVDMTTKYPNITLTSQHDTQSGYTKSDAKLEVIPGEDKLFAKTAFFSWGITLTVKPRISPDGLISVEIVPSISELDTDVTADGFYQISGGTDAPYGRYPIIKYKRLTTDFTMKDGATAVIGGLSKTEEGDVDSGIPYLRDIPWIGNKLFGWKSRGKVQKEIIVFVTVGIADPTNLPEDIGLPKNAVRGREYVQKRAMEPGDRPGAAAEVLKLDMRPMEMQRKDYAQGTVPVAPASGKGTVTITPSKK